MRRHYTWIDRMNSLCRKTGKKWVNNTKKNVGTGGDIKSRGIRPYFRSCRWWLGGGQGSPYATSLACENGSPVAWEMIFPHILLNLIFLSGWPCLNYGMQVRVSSSMGDSAQASGVQDQFYIVLFSPACTLDTNLRVSCRRLSRCGIRACCLGVKWERERESGGGGRLERNNSKILAES